MEDAKPQMEPGFERRSVGKARVDAPSQVPAQANQGGTAVQDSAPPVVMASREQGSPSLPVTAGAVGGDVGAWQNSKTLTALWTNGQPRNAWAGVGGIGWKKLSTASDSASVALTLLSAHAREKNSVVNYRDESDGMIHEMYVW